MKFVYITARNSEFESEAKSLLVYTVIDSEQTRTYPTAIASPEFLSVTKLFAIMFTIGSIVWKWKV